MARMIKLHWLRNNRRVIVSGIIGLMPMIGLADPTSLLEKLLPGEPWNNSLIFAPKAAIFNQQTNTSGGTDANAIAKITLSFFQNGNCNGTPFGSHTTPNSPPTFPIAINDPFGLTAEGTWNAGLNAGISSGNMPLVNSVAVILRSNNTNTPQASFAGSTCGTNPSFCCVPVSCSGGACNPSTPIGQQDFELKTTAAVGDPADGGVIGCLSPNLVVPAGDNSTGIQWGGFGTSTNATNSNNGSSNTAIIVNCLTNGVGCPGGIPVNTYAAGICSIYSTTGGYTTGWYLPARDELNCLYTNQVAIGGFNNAAFYWSSTESSSLLAFEQNFGTGTQFADNKSLTIQHVRCARQYTP